MNMTETMFRVGNRFIVHMSADLNDRAPELDLNPVWYPSKPTHLTDAEAADYRTCRSIFALELANFQRRTIRVTGIIPEVYEPVYLPPPLYTGRA